MKYALPTIGGMFGSGDHQRFLRSDAAPGFDSYFPLRIRDRQRCDYETGIDSLAAILFECCGSDRPIRLWAVENFCHDSLGRLQIKLQNRIEFRKYQSCEELHQLTTGDVVLYLHFNWYDPASRDAIELIRRKTGATVIEDFAQAPLDISLFAGDYAMTSLRKFSSLDLAIAYQKSAYPASTQETPYHKLRKQAEFARTQFLLNPSETAEQLFLKLYQESDATTAVPLISGAHPQEIERARSFDFKSVQELRRANFARLSERLRLDAPAIKILPGDYMYLMVETANRDPLRRALFARRIFPPIHWADSHCEQAKSLLSFHIDQRYSVADMDRVADAVVEIGHQLANR